jgi:hypothetical protein
VGNLLKYNFNIQEHVYKRMYEYIYTRVYIYIYSRDKVTVDGVWIANLIYHSRVDSNYQ